MQQQHEKKRRKRDYPGANLPSTVFAGSTDFFQQQSSGGSLSSLGLGQSFRRLGNTVHNVFPDPLFKEQWYLVSNIIKRNMFNYFLTQTNFNMITFQ